MGLLDLDQKAIAQTANVLIDDHLRAGRRLCFTLSSSSMWPALAPGDKIYVRAAHVDKLRRGDILVQRVEALWIAHRLIDCVACGGETLLVTKGDNALAADTSWPAAQLVGVVVAVARAWPKAAMPLVQAKWRASLIALLSGGQLLAARIRPTFCRRLAIKISRACLWIAARPDV